MILLLLFLISSMALGYLLARKLQFIVSWLEKAAASLIMGLAISTLAAFAISFFLGALSDFSILLASIFNIGAAYFVVGGDRFRARARVPTFTHIRLGKIGFPEIAISLVFLTIAYFNVFSIYSDDSGNIYGIANTWADYAFHVGIINSFALRDNFPPIYPNLAQTQMRYPFMVDFLSSIFVKGGIPLIYSITIPNFILIFCLVYLSYAFLMRFLGKKGIAALAILLFFFNGNLGFAYFLEDFNAAPDKMEFLGNIPKAYSYLPDKNLQFMNLVYSVFIPQRAALMGFPIVMLIFTLLWRIYNHEAQRVEYFIAGLLLGLLPLVHASSFGVAAGLSICILAMAGIRNKRAAGGLAIFILTALILAIPQLFFINEQVRSENFFGGIGGWMVGTAQATGKISEFLRFWWENAGPTLILGIAGIIFLKKRQFIFILPLLALFAISNLIRFQPWEWDNVKMLMYWYFAQAALAAVSIQRIYEYFRRMNLALGYAIVAAILLLSTLSAILTFAYWANSGAMLWSASEIRTASFISANTPKDALFAAAGKHNHPAYTIGGRQVIAGYDGHLWSHGLIYAEQDAVNRKIISEIDEGLIRKWEVGYIYAGYAEINEWGASPEIMEKSPLLEKIYEAPEIGVRIFKVRDFD